VAVDAGAVQAASGKAEEAEESGGAGAVVDPSNPERSAAWRREAVRRH